MMPVTGCLSLQLTAIVPTVVHLHVIGGAPSSVAITKPFVTHHAYLKRILHHNLIPKLWQIENKGLPLPHA